MRRCGFSLITALALTFSLGVQQSAGLEKPGDELKSVAPTTKLGTNVPMDLQFTAEDGSTGSLAQFAKADRPMIIVPAYYHCAHLCGLVMKGVQEMLQSISLKLNQDFRVLTVSFDPDDTPENALNRSRELLPALPDQEAAHQGWRFLVGKAGSSATLMQQLGFQYSPDKGEFAHSAAIMILTPGGQISQYFTGISFPPRDVKLALVEAGRGSIGSPIDHLLLFCFRFDQTKGRYTWAAYNIMRAGGALTLVALVTLFFRLRRVESKSVS